MPQTHTAYDSKERDREQRERPSNLRSALGAEMCQMCGSTDGMLALYRGLAGEMLVEETVYQYKDRWSVVYVPCETCNPRREIGDGFRAITDAEYDAWMAADDKRVGDRCCNCPLACQTDFPNCEWDGFTAAQTAGNEAYAAAGTPEEQHDAYRAAFDAEMAKGGTRQHI